MGSTAHLKAHQFKPGQIANPAGRPKGSRAKLQELAVALLHDDFVEHGAEVIRKVRQRRPEVYLASVVSLLPKRTEKIESPLVDISDDELAQLTEHLKAIRAKTVKRMLRLDPAAVATSPQPQPEAAAAQARSPDQPLPDPDAPARTKPASISVWDALEQQRHTGNTGKTREEIAQPHADNSAEMDREQRASLQNGNRTATSSD
jgi:hypothetical protein